MIDTTGSPGEIDHQKLSERKHSIITANFCMVLDNENNLQILKNRWGDPNNIDEELTFTIISKFILNLCNIDELDSLKLFSEPIKNEIIETCKNIYEKYKVKAKPLNISKPGSVSYATRDEGIVTSLIGYLLLKYDEIVEIFGEPNYGVSGDYKVDWEWILKINNCIITIYNYKDGPSYTRNKSIGPNDIENWHVGGAHRKSLEVLDRKIRDITGIKYANIQLTEVDWKNLKNNGSWRSTI